MKVKDYSIKGIREDFKKQGIFYTPEELALYLKSFIDIQYKTAYDPTCGRGSLLSVLDDEIKKYGQELNDSELEIARKTLKNFTGAVGDTLKNPAFMDKKFDVILANPPFSIKWEPLIDERFIDAPCVPTASRADYAFLLHILYMLEDNGIAIVLNFPGILYRGGREGKLRKYLVEKNYIDKVIKIPKDSFIDTKIETCILVFRKNKTNTDIEFIDKELEETKTISLKAIQDNNYNLSIKQYIFKEDVKEEVDPLELELEARAVLLAHIKNSLLFSLTVMSLEGGNEKYKLDNFIDEIIETVSKFKGKTNIAEI